MDNEFSQPQFKSNLNRETMKFIAGSRMVNEHGQRTMKFIARSRIMIMNIDKKFQLISIIYASIQIKFGQRILSSSNQIIVDS